MIRLGKARRRSEHLQTDRIAVTTLAVFAYAGNLMRWCAACTDSAGAATPKFAKVTTHTVRTDASQAVTSPLVL